MKISKDIDPTGTSFHGVTIQSTADKVEAVMGDSNGSSRKTNFKWCGMTNDGQIFTVYDRKMFKGMKGTVSKNETVVFNIGGFSKESEEKAKEELIALLK